MGHDQLAKTLIASFFSDFLHLTAPESAGRLRLGEASFLDKELFTDWPVGGRRELDLLVQVPVEGGARALLIHVEIEARANRGMDLRLWGYYMQIRQRHKLLVLPILINLRGGRPGVRLEALEEGFFEPLATGVFRYRVLSLAGCRAVEWLSRPEPLAWALAALMQPGAWSRAELKMECLRRVRHWKGPGGRKDILVNWIETYIQLSREDAVEYRRLLSLQDNEEIREMEMTWLGKAEARGVRKGRAEGLREGKAQAVEQMRKMVLQAIEQRFGAVPERVQARVQSIRVLEPLGTMLQQLPLVQSADDLLPRRGRPRS